MNKFYEYLTDTRNMAKEKGARLWQALTNQNDDTKPQIEPIQLDQNGKYDPQASLDLKVKTQPRSLWEHLTGRTVSVDNPTINQPLLDYQNQLRNQGFDENTVNGVAQGLNSGNKNIAAKIDELGINKPQNQADIDLAKQGQFNTPTLSTATISQYQPGFFNNFGAGFKENFSTPISANNFGQNTLADGRRKGFGYRAGEVLGTMGRVLESPLGRGLLTAGIVGATGGSGLEALAYGGQAGLLNQTSRMNDQMYRNSLNEQGIDTTGLRGYVNQDTYKNLSSTNTNYQKMLNAQAIALAKDNTARAKLIMNGVNNGYISPEAASLMINQYGITDADFQESNESRKTDSQIAYTEAKMEDVKNPKPRIVKMQYSGLPSTKTVNVNNTYDNKRGNNPTGTPSPLGKNGTVRVKHPNGQIGSIPANRVQDAVKAGYIVLGG